MDLILPVPEYEGFILEKMKIPIGYPFPPPTGKSVASGLAPVKPISSPVKPISTPVKPKSIPVKPISTPVQPKSIPVQPKSTPVHPVSAPPQPTPIPDQPNPTVLQDVKISTQHYPGAFDTETADFAYEYLVNTIEWEDGVRSRRTGFTRKAKAIGFNSDEVVQNLILGVLQMIQDPANREEKSFGIGGIYLNWYRDGNDYTPSHSHETCQLIISLGSTRTLRVGNRDIPSGHGDVIVFGRSLHGVPKEPDVSDGRISIAVFLM